MRKLGEQIISSPIVGGTPLLILKAPGWNNRILAKLEYANPTGSHYDRVYPALITELETRRKIKPSITTLVETTSGNAGISCAYYAKQRGYGCTIFAPASLPHNRLQPMEDYGATVVKTPPEGYVAEASRRMKEFLKTHNQTCEGVRCFYSPNHSQERIAWSSLEVVVEEVAQQIGEMEVHCFIGAAGNGSTLRGIGGALKRMNPRARIFAFEPEQARTAHQLMYPSANIDHWPSKHEMYGTGVWGVEFPHLRFAVENLLEDVFLIANRQWDAAQKELKRLGFHVGTTSCAAYQLAQEWCRENAGQNVMIVFYDTADRY